MWGSVLGPHTLTHFPTPPLSLPLTPAHFPTPLPALLHFPHIFPYSSPHPNTLPYTVHLPHTSSVFPQLSSPPPTPQHTSPLTPCTLSHLYPHLPYSLDYVAKLPCDELTLNLTGLWKSPMKFFTTTRN